MCDTFALPQPSSPACRSHKTSLFSSVLFRQMVALASLAFLQEQISFALARVEAVRSIDLVETAWHILTRSLSSFALSHVTWKKPIAVASMQHVALCLAATSAKTELWSSICAVCISLQPLLKVYSLLHSTFFTRSILGHFSIRLPCKGSNLLCQTAQPPSSSCSWN